MKNIRYLTIHAAATSPSMDIGVKEIREWHLARKPPFRDIGYHFVIRRNGVLEKGRPLNQMGAHVGGHNTGNIGICMVGGVRESDRKTPEDNFTPEQYQTLYELIYELHLQFPAAIIMGHNGFPEHESRGCPCFDWRKWRTEFLASLKEPEPVFDGHWLEEVDFSATTN